MTMFSNDANTSRITLLDGQQSGKAAEAVAVNSDSDSGAVTLSLDSNVGEAEDERATFIISKMETEAEDGSAIYTIVQTATVTNNESITSMIHEAMMETFFSSQTGETRLNLLEVLSKSGQANHENAMLTISGTETEAEDEDEDEDEDENEDEDESAINAVSQAETETSNEVFMSTMNNALIEQLLGDQTVRGSTWCLPSEPDEANRESSALTGMGTETESEETSATYTVDHVETVSQLETAADNESTNSVIDKTLMEQCLKDQSEETKLNLLEISRDTNIDDVTRSFALAVAIIVDWWQYYAQEDNPTSLQIHFGPPLTLLMVFALLPEKYQGFISVVDENRSPFGNDENLSWLHEQTMEVLVSISMDPAPTSHIFGRSLGSMMRNDVDAAWRVFTGRCWLEDQMFLLSSGQLEPDDLYQFPPETKKIVFFFNPTEAHWTTVEIDLSDEVWTYSIYNSLSQGEKGPTWNACHEQFPFLEQLICRASGFPEPKTREIIAAASAQQDNAYDCGPIALYNAMELLEGRKPGTAVDTDNLRLKYLMLILDALPLLDQGLGLAEFRSRMRELWLNSSV